MGESTNCEEQRNITMDLKDHCDRFSLLPNDIVHRIISLLTMEDAILTSFLSRRWRDQWKFTSNIDFGDSWVERRGKDLVSSVTQSLALLKGHKIEKFSVSFSYTPDHAHQVESWINFALSHEVEELKLILDNDYPTEPSTSPCYKFPDCLFNGRSLSSLTLGFCTVELPITMNFQSLKTVDLYRIELPPTAIEQITDNSPLLEALTFHDCCRTTNLIIKIVNPNVQELVIGENLNMVHKDTNIRIDAPNLQKLFLFGHITREWYFIWNISSNAVVSFSFELMFQERSLAIAQEEVVEDSLALKGLVSAFHNVKSLALCNWCLEMISAHDMSFGLPFFRLSYLELRTSFRKSELLGIANMILSCLNLYYLSIDISELPEPEIQDRGNLATNVNPRDFWRAMDPYCRGRLQLLSVIHIYDDKKDINECLRSNENCREFLRFLEVPARGPIWLVYTQRAHEALY